MPEAGESLVDLVVDAGRYPTKLRDPAPGGRLRFAGQRGARTQPRGLGGDESLTVLLADVWKRPLGWARATPTLAMLVERELAVRRFVHEDYIEVVATFHPQGRPADQQYKGTWLRDRKVAGDD